MVEQGHTTESRQNIFLSGFSAASRFTMLISVPTAMTLPGAASATTRLMYSVEPLESAACTTSIVHSGMHYYMNIRVHRPCLLDLLHSKAGMNRAVPLPKN